MTTNTKTVLLTSRSASLVPGDTRRELVKTAIAEDGGNILPGTIYQPVSLGYDNVLNTSYQEIIVIEGVSRVGERVRVLEVDNRGFSDDADEVQS